MIEEPVLVHQEVAVFVVPDEFNRNAPDVRKAAPQADTGLVLIQYLCERLGIPDLAGLDVLDYGCGVRFTDTILNRNVALKSYVGIDVYREMVDWLIANVTDPRLTYFHMNSRNPMYNPGGEQLGPDTRLPLGDRLFDVICMFSGITHQLPEDSQAIFSMLRRYVRPRGHLFFSVCLEEGDFEYRETDPNSPTGLSVYSQPFLMRLLTQAGWHVLSVVPRNPRGLPILASLLCAPA
jgi:SAM-dependent methyltransferase